LPHTTEDRVAKLKAVLVARRLHPINNCKNCKQGMDSCKEYAQLYLKSLKEMGW
jgi:hypothetical protein